MPVEIGGDEYLTAAEAAAFLGVKTATLYAYASRGVVRSYREGIKRRRLYKRSELAGLVVLRAGEAPLPRAEDWVPYTG